MGVILQTERGDIIGALPPPPGVIPNFVNPDSRGYQVIIATAIMFPIATLILFLRIYTRVIIVRDLGSDDYAIMIAWIMLIACLTTSLLLIKIGLGVHIWNVPLTTFSPHFLKLAVINGVFYGMSFMCVKLSILFLYLRLSPYRPFRIAVWVVIATTVAYSFLGSFEFLFNCRPIAKNWDIMITHGSCIDVAKILLTHGSISLLTDVAMLILPIALVWKLKLPMKQRVAIGGLFMTGTLVCIVTSVRLKTIVDLIHSPDFTGEGVSAQVWSTIEVCFGIICACLPNFKPFLRRHFPKVIGSANKSEGVVSNDELESRERKRRSSTARISKQQISTNNESREDVFREGHPKDIVIENGVTKD